MFVPLAFSDRELKPKVIVFTLDQAPTVFSLTKAFFRYDKKFAFSFRMDDGEADCYRACFPLFSGGDVEYVGGGSDLGLPGLFYTDGCGNNIAFKASNAVESGSVSNNTNPPDTGKMNWTMISGLYANGWQMMNHTRNGTVGASFDSDPAVAAQQALDEILNCDSDFRQNSGIQLRSFSAPSADQTYKPVSLGLAGQNKLQYVAGGYEPSTFAKDRAVENWQNDFTLSPRTDFTNLISSNLTLTAADLDYIATELLEASNSYHKWFVEGTHNVGLADSDTPTGNEMRYLETKDFFTRLESTYGASGSDIMWMAPEMDIVEYVVTRINSVVNVVVSGNTVTVSIDYSGVPFNFRNHPLSFLVDTDANITGISYSNFDESSHNIGVITGDDGNSYDALVNVSYKPDYDAALTKRANAYFLVGEAERTLQQAEKTAAQDFVNTLPNGSFKDDLQARIDAVIVVPDSRVFQIDFDQNIVGSGEGSPWNVLDSVSGSINPLRSTVEINTGVSMAVTTAFNNSHNNTGVTNGDSNIPFNGAYNACRDGMFRSSSENTPSVVVFSGLLTSKVYDFEIFGSRGSNVGNITNYNIIDDGGTENVQLVTRNNGSGNVYNTAVFTSKVPNSSGEITLEVDNNGSGQAGYINAMQITERTP